MSQNNLRISLGFSGSDPEQVRVVEILKEKGRKKSKFITDAVLFYMANKYDPLPEKTAIRKIVMEVLEELNNSQNNPQNILQNDFPNNSQNKNKSSNNVPSEYFDDDASIFDEEEKKNDAKNDSGNISTDLSDDVLGGFLDALDSFD